MRPRGSRPPKGRTWGRRGHTPVVRVTAQNAPRLSLAALVAVKPGHRPRLIYRTHRGRRGRAGQGLPPGPFPPPSSPPPPATPRPDPAGLGKSDPPRQRRDGRTDRGPA